LRSKLIPVAPVADVNLLARIPHAGGPLLSFTQAIGTLGAVAVELVGLYTNPAEVLISASLWG
jgi:hypothetical protein